MRLHNAHPAHEGRQRHRLRHWRHHRHRCHRSRRTRCVVVVRAARRCSAPVCRAIDVEVRKRRGAQTLGLGIQNARGSWMNPCPAQSRRRAASTSAYSHQRGAQRRAPPGGASSALVSSTPSRSGTHAPSVPDAELNRRLVPSHRNRTGVFRRTVYRRPRSVSVSSAAEACSLKRLSEERRDESLLGAVKRNFKCRVRYQFNAKCALCRVISSLQATLP